jgi:hypothetical protein
LGGLGSCVGEGVASSVRRAVGVMLPPLPSQCAPCAPCFLVWSGTPFPVPPAAWKRCPCNFVESGRWLVCGGRGRGQGQGQGQGQVLGGFRLGVSTHPPPPHHPPHPHPNPRARLAAPTHQYPLSTDTRCPRRVCAREQGVSLLFFLLSPALSRLFVVDRGSATGPPSMSLCKMSRADGGGGGGVCDVRGVGAGRMGRVVFTCSCANVHADVCCV